MEEISQIFTRAISEFIIYIKIYLHNVCTGICTYINNKNKNKRRHNHRQILHSLIYIGIPYENITHSEKDALHRPMASLEVNERCALHIHLLLFSYL